MPGHQSGIPNPLDNTSLANNNNNENNLITNKPRSNQKLEQPVATSTPPITSTTSTTPIKASQCSPLPSSPAALPTSPTMSSAFKSQWPSNNMSDLFMAYCGGPPGSAGSGVHPHPHSHHHYGHHHAQMQHLAPPPLPPSPQENHHHHQSQQNNLVKFWLIFVNISYVF